MDISAEEFRILALSPFQHHVVLISSEAEWAKIAPGLECTSEDWLAGGAACVRDRQSSSIVCLNPVGELHDYVEYICHESTHVFQNMCGQACEPNPSVEFEAYYIGHIAGWLFEQTINEYMENQTS